jgi:hypothetical protein
MVLRLKDLSLTGAGMFSCYLCLKARQVPKDFLENPLKNDENRLETGRFWIESTQHVMGGGKVKSYLNGYRMYLIRYKMMNGLGIWMERKTGSG